MAAHVSCFTVIAVCAVAMAAAWPWPQQVQLPSSQQQTAQREVDRGLGGGASFPTRSGGNPVFPPSNREQGPSSSSSSSSSPSSSVSNSSGSSGSVDSSWLYKSMTKMALEAHNVIVTGSQIRSCGSSSSRTGGFGGGIRKVENVVFSPLSVSAALSTLMVGSWGDTLSELRTGLGYPRDLEALSESNIHSTYKSNLDTLLKPGRGVDINYANTIFGNAGLSVIAYFYQDIQNYYKSTIRGVDFENKPVQAMKEINRWVGEQTKGKITDILNSPPSTDTKMAVANAVYFKGAWAYQFSEEFTRVEDFTVEDGDTVKAAMMKEVMEIPYVRDSKVQAAMIALPYKTLQFALYIMLPDQPGLSGLVNLEKSLTEADVDSMIRRMSVSTVQVAIPRIKMSWRSDLKDVLSKMGVCDVFSPSQADFRRLATGNDGLFLSYLTHQADIEINERGTEAAAATVGAISKTARSFTANRPFLFFIRDNLTGLPLFWGRIVRPDTSAAAPSTTGSRN